MGRFWRTSSSVVTASVSISTCQTPRLSKFYFQMDESPRKPCPWPIWK